jgi:hypothetical protein
MEPKPGVKYSFVYPAISFSFVAGFALGELTLLAGIMGSDLVKPYWSWLIGTFGALTIAVIWIIVQLFINRRNYSRILKDGSFKGPVFKLVFMVVILGYYLGLILHPLLMQLLTVGLMGFLKITVH